MGVPFSLQGMQTGPSLEPAATQPPPPVKDEFSMPSLSDVLAPHQLSLVDQVYPKDGTPGYKNDFESLVAQASQQGTTPQDVLAKQAADKATKDAYNSAMEETPESMLAKSLAKFSDTLDGIEKMHPDAQNLTIAQMKEIIGQAASIPQYQYKPPSLAENLAAGLAMMLNPHGNGGQLLGGMTQQHTADSQAQYARDTQAYQLNEQERRNKVSELGNVAQMQGQQFQHEQGVQLQGAQMMLQNATRADQMAMAHQDKEMSRDSMLLGKLSMDYEKKPTEFLRAQLNALNAKLFGASAQPIDNDAFEKDVAQWHTAQLGKASALWESLKNNQARNYGHIPDSYEQTRQQIATEYGIDPNLLSPIEGGETLRAQHEKVWQTNLAESLKLKDKNVSSEIANRLAMRDQAAERIAIAKQNSAISGNNSNETAAYHRYLEAQKGVESEFDKLLPHAQADLAAAQGALKVAATPQAKQKAQTTVAEAQARIDFINSTKEPTIQIPGLGELPNPNFKGNINIQLPPTDGGSNISGPIGQPSKGKQQRIVNVPYNG